MTMHFDHDGFAAGLVRDLAEHQARESARSLEILTTSEAGISREALRKLALLRTEVLHVSAIVSLVTSIANRLHATPDRRVSVRALTAFIPAFSTMSETLVADLIDDATFFSFAQLWQILNSRLAFALLLNIEVVRAADLNGAAFDSADCEMASDAWQRVCKATLKLHAEISQLMGASGVVCERSVERPALDLLHASAAGGSPCFDERGRMSVPGWAERRTDTRCELKLPVSLSVGGVTGKANLIDVSRSGLGLAFPTMVPIGTHAIVSLPDSRKLDGFVSWSKGGRMGVKLAGQLPKDDPLLVDIVQ